MIHKLSEIGEPGRDSGIRSGFSSRIAHQVAQLIEQRLTTREPTLDQLEVSIRALREVLDLEGGEQPTDRRVEVMA